MITSTVRQDSSEIVTFNSHDLTTLSAKYNESLITKLEQEYEADLSMLANTLPRTKFNYGIGLCLNSFNKKLNHLGILLLEELIDEAVSTALTSDCLFYMAIGNYNLGKFRQARLLCERLLKRSPDNNQALLLHGIIREKVFEEGLSGLGLTIIILTAASFATKIMLKNVK